MSRIFAKVWHRGIVRRARCWGAAARTKVITMRNYDNYVNAKFGRATIKEVVDRDHVHCVCECGKEFTTRLRHLTSGNTKSCGCLQKDKVTSRGTTHGKSKHPLYKTWHNMRSRCKNPNASKYELYGGRGISVCEEWDKNFEEFFNWSVSNGWEPGKSIDRINSDKGYCPENCRWVDVFTQNNNLRSNHVIDYNGETHSVYEWARLLGINPKTLSERIRRGWSVERALNTP